MEIVKVALGDLQANCYIIINELSECVIVDPGAESSKVIELLELRGLTLKAILITHGHFDHIGGVNGLVKHFKVPVYAHEGESVMMSDPKLNLSGVFSQDLISCKADKLIRDDDHINLGVDLEFTAIEVPGHTGHSICFLNEQGHVFTGDTLFNGAVGRTDLYDGAPRDLIVNIREKLFVLDNEVKVYPGHGMQSTIIHEQSTNPFFS